MHLHILYTCVHDYRDSKTGQRYGPVAARIGIMTYSDNTEMHWKLNEPDPTLDVTSIRLMGGSRNTAQAIKVGMKPIWNTFFFLFH